MRFENKTAVVTGGSRGIGLAIATKLAKEGANIAILYVGDENEGIKAKEELSQYGTKVEQYFCDVSNFEESKKVVDHGHRGVRQYRNSCKQRRHHKR